MCAVVINAKKECGQCGLVAKVGNQQLVGIQYPRIGSLDASGDYLGSGGEGGVELLDKIVRWKTR
jgi:hypothetical protein